MFAKCAVYLLTVGLVLSAPSDSYGPAKHQQTYKEEPTPYKYNYNINDKYAGTDFGHNEESDGHTVKGSYTVQLPDGRKQTVNYIADHYQGYQAEVTYYGEAQYPHEYGPAVTFKPQSYHEPAYKPEPSYQPEPSYSPEPSYQPEPSYSPEPSYQPEPSYSPEPANQPAPSYAPEPTYQPAAPSYAPEPSYQ
ncbi:adhesive plaque matrix protein-like [Macrobrachium nipponense]|uniref:adhesive plaque matrix protein-like n=1 Tax=Macrobrachium nipponense TaxID=159736 RepID=UPI0030C7AB37